MKEPAYNLFVYVEMPTIKELGVAVHHLDGTDQEKLLELQNLVDTDYKTAARYRPRNLITWEYYEGLVSLGLELSVFEAIFQDLNAPKQPLVVITPVVNGKPHFMAVTKLGPLRRDDLKGTPLEEPGTMVDYLDAYVTDNGFDIPRLLNDDYFLAIKLLFNSKYFVSCAKLLMSFIDTIAFIDAGDIKDSFILWLDTYADLTPLGVTSKELWEFRNGLLHMTNLRSRAVASGKISPLVLSAGNPARPLPSYRNGAKRVNLKALIGAIADAISQWVETYNHNREKLAYFVSRYDLTVSDMRVAYFSLEGPPEDSV
ncbi:MAG: hypothetical protein WA419_13780 [Silvibacterium sp.]